MEGKQVLILVDSGSSGSFISQNAVEKLQLTPRPTKAVTVVVADGAKLECSTEVPEVIWHCQNNVFSSTLRVFDLKGYDMILGMDWLESCGDMWVGWEKKTLRFRHAGKRITLGGIKDRTDSCEQISGAQLHKLLKNDQVAQVVQLCPIQQERDTINMPASIAQVVMDFEHCFGEP